MTYCDRCGEPLPNDRTAGEWATNDRAAGAPAADDRAAGAPPENDRTAGESPERDHAACVAARQLEPPRFCRHCRRRMKVQVVPTGWSATCVEHGTVSGQ